MNTTNKAQYALDKKTLRLKALLKYCFLIFNTLEFLNFLKNKTV
jgi:hypothetical protein